MTTLVPRQQHVASFITPAAVHHPVPHIQRAQHQTNPVSPPLPPLQHILDRKQPQDAKLVHVLSSGLKAAATWLRVEGLQDCRECCGGMGFLSANRIGPVGEGGGRSIDLGCD